MRDEQVAAAREAADDGIAFDGFAFERDGGEYVRSTPEADARTVRSDAGDALADADEYLTNWYFWHAVAPQAEDRWAFLRWIEDADATPVPDRYDELRAGVGREWGQLRITATVADDGERRYALRHVDDADAAPESVEAHDDPLEARSLAKRDDDGRYRPLKTAPSLATGWQFPDLSAAALVRTVDFFYPATVANWYREREGRLDVTHWRETAKRQTGIYEMIEGLGDEGVARLAEACCVDSQCLKRREWDLDEDAELDVPRGDGTFPCREPCSLVVAAARKFTTLESERTRAYELELTLSEKNQIEEIIDAVADGAVDEIREGDVYEGANRYRARYLRAKLFEGGELPAREVDDGDGRGPASDANAE